MDGLCRKVNRSLRKHLFRRAAPPDRGHISGQERTDTGGFVFLDLRNRPLSDDFPAVRSGLGPHLHYPVRLGENLHVMIHQDHRVAVADQIVHHRLQADDVGGVKTYGGLVQHIEDAGGPVSHRPGKLEPLALSRR